MTKKSYVAENGLTIGLAGLALLVIFAIALPRWVHNTDTRAISLPDKLSGGYAAAASADPSAKQMADGLSSSMGGVAASSRIYGAADQQNLLIVSAVRSPSGVLLAPAGATFSKVGDDVCMVTAIPRGSQATGFIAQQMFVCRHASTELTVQVAASSDMATAAKYADEIFSKIS